MKTLTKSLSLILLFCAFTFTSALAQTKDNPYIFKFTKENGHVVKPLKDNTKRINFKVEGLSSQTEVDKLIEQVKTYSYVKTVTISDKLEGVDRKGQIILSYEADADYFKKILTDLGVKTIFVDGVEEPVSEMGKKK